MRFRKLVAKLRSVLYLSSKENSSGAEGNGKPPVRRGASKRASLSLDCSIETSSVHVVDSWRDIQWKESNTKYAAAEAKNIVKDDDNTQHDMNKKQNKAKQTALLRPTPFDTYAAFLENWMKKQATATPAYFRRIRMLQESSVAANILVSMLLLSSPILLFPWCLDRFVSHRRRHRNGSLKIGARSNSKH